MYCIPRRRRLPGWKARCWVLADSIVAARIHTHTVRSYSSRMRTVARFLPIDLLRSRTPYRTRLLALEGQTSWLCASLTPAPLGQGGRPPGSRARARPERAGPAQSIFACRIRPAPLPARGRVTSWSIAMLHEGGRHRRREPAPAHGAAAAGMV